jgi:hypothetical protein
VSSLWSAVARLYEHSSYLFLVRVTFSSERLRA